MDGNQIEWVVAYECIGDFPKSYILKYGPLACGSDVLLF